MRDDLKDAYGSTIYLRIDFVRLRRHCHNDFVGMQQTGRSKHSLSISYKVRRPIMDHSKLNTSELPSDAIESIEETGDPNGSFSPNHSSMDYNFEVVLRLVDSK